MPRFTDLDADFACPLHKGCPYLEGLPTKWVWDGYQKAVGQECHYELLLKESRQELAAVKARLAEVEKERDQFKAQYYALHRSQFKQKRKPLPPEPPHPKSKKRGAPVGHPPWQRKVKQIDQIIEVSAPSVCPHCQSTSLMPSQKIQEHVQEDIVLEPRTVATAFRHEQAWCEKCERLVWKTGPGELPGAYIGPVAKATATYLRYQLNVPYRKVSRFFADLFGLKFVPASAYGFDRQVSRRGAPLYEDLRQKIQALKVIHADETSWRHEGKNYWVWYGGDEDLACFVWDAHRSGESAQNLLGTKFGGVLVVDGLASYNAVHPKARQSCLAHIHRTAKNLAQELSLLEGVAKDPAAVQMCGQVQALVHEACQSAREDKPWRAGVMKKKEKDFRKQLNEICASKLVYPRAESFRKRLLGPEQAQLFTFLRHPNVPPTNNQAERSLRPVVIMRKVIQGTRSPWGLENHSILRSLMETGKRQGKDIRELFQILLTQPTTEAQRALYRDSS